MLSLKENYKVNEFHDLQIMGFNTCHISSSKEKQRANEFLDLRTPRILSKPTTKRVTSLYFRRGARKIPTAGLMLPTRGLTILVPQP